MSSEHRDIAPFLNAWAKSGHTRARFAHYVVGTIGAGMFWTKCSQAFAVGSLMRAQRDDARCARCVAETSKAGGGEADASPSSSTSSSPREKADG